MEGEKQNESNKADKKINFRKRLSSIKEVFCTKKGRLAISQLKTVPRYEIGYLPQQQTGIYEYHHRGTSNENFLIPSPREGCQS